MLKKCFIIVIIIIISNKCATPECVYFTSEREEPILFIIIPQRSWLGLGPVYKAVSWRIACITLLTRSWWISQDWQRKFQCNLTAHKTACCFSIVVYSDHEVPILLCLGKDSCWLHLSFSPVPTMEAINQNPTTFSQKILPKHVPGLKTQHHITWTAKFQL